MELQTSIIVNPATGVVADNALPLCELARQLEEASGSLHQGIEPIARPVIG